MNTVTLARDAHRGLAAAPAGARLPGGSAVHGPARRGDPGLRRARGHRGRPDGAERPARVNLIHVSNLFMRYLPYHRIPNVALTMVTIDVCPTPWAIIGSAGSRADRSGAVGLAETTESGAQLSRRTFGRSSGT